ncbi:MAG: hypothetical protein HKO59_03395 [Phycisphaerales bacterium]|nr:hypothetical protein [Phycisphaerae bacterium]NNF42631.1 hypothetical protein [Phycisphaerales bacterium]NNM25026.1 hypothetical protein [Phycisphaerales bacterium]
MSESRTRRRWTWLLPLLLLSVAGCSTYRAYPGPRLPATEVALLEVPVHPRAIDGTTLPRRGDVARVELLPGAHEVEWRFVYPNAFVQDQRLSFYAEAGGRYRLGERFFADPHAGGPIGALLDVAIDASLAPVRLLIGSEPPGEPTPGEYFCWVIDTDSQAILAGVPPNVPAAHSPIGFLPVQTELVEVTE